MPLNMWCNNCTPDKSEKKCIEDRGQKTCCLDSRLKLSDAQQPNLHGFFSTVKHSVNLYQAHKRFAVKRLSLDIEVETAVRWWHKPQTQTERIPNEQQFAFSESHMQYAVLSFHILCF